MTETLYTKKSLALLLKTTRETLSLYLKTEKIKDLVEIVGLKYNKVTLKLLVSFEEFDREYQEIKTKKIKTAAVVGAANTRARKAKMANQ